MGVSTLLLRRYSKRLSRMQAEPGLEPPFRWNAAESPALTAGLCISQGPLKETEAIPAILIRKGFNPGR